MAHMGVFHSRGAHKKECNILGSTSGFPYYAD